MIFLMLRVRQGTMCSAVQQIFFTGKSGKFSLYIDFFYQELSKVREGRFATGFTTGKRSGLCLPISYAYLCGMYFFHT